MVEGNFIGPRVLIVVVLILGCLGLAYAWRKPSLQPSALRTSAESVAGDFRWWFGAIAAIWLYTIGMNALTEIRRNNEIVALRNDVQSIANVIDRGVMPRHLTKGQQSQISSFLLRFPPQKVRFNLVRGEEAGSYRSDIQQALEKGGWSVAKIDYIDSATPYEGLRIDFTQTMDHSQQQEDPRNPKPDRVLLMALGLAGVRLNSSGGGSGINVTEDSLVITIGPPRRDSYQLTPPPGLPF